MNEFVSIGFSIVLLAAVIAIFIRISRKVKKGGSGATITALGALYDLHSAEGKRSIETIVELNAKKKLEEQESSDTED